MYDGLFERLDKRTAQIAVLGQGYVGLVVAMRANQAGFPVLGLEIDPERAAALADGTSYVEDIPDDELQRALDSGYRPSSDPADLTGFDVAVISVPTPLHEGLPQLDYIEDAARMVGDVIEPGSLVILESTTYPGTTEELVRDTIEQASGLTAGDDFLLGYSPERIDPGNRDHDLSTTPKIVSGIDQTSLEAVSEFFGAFVDKLVPVDSPGIAELAKLIENTFRHVNIALINELAMFASDLDVDIWAAIDAASTKPFGFMRFTPGPGVGGHCLPVDPTYLSWRVKRRLGETFRFVELANDVNEHMPDYVVKRVQALLNDHKKPVNGSHIVVLGLSYKPNTGDAREAPSGPIIARLCELGAAVTAVDPHVDHDGIPLDDCVTRTTDLEEVALSEADLVVLVTDHDSFDYDRIAGEARLILDTRNRIGRADNVEHL